MDDLSALAARLASLLKQREQTIAIAESSAGGLISASLVGLPGASSFFVGGGVVYTSKARAALLGITSEALEGMRPSTERYALLLARTIRERLAATWGLAESGATGPAGNRYGDAAGHVCLAIAGGTERVVTLETGSADRQSNMRRFATAALELLLESIEKT